MLMIVIGIFIILHGLSHLLFFLQGMRIFELKSGLLGWIPPGRFRAG